MGQTEPSSRGKTQPEITPAAEALDGTYWKETSRYLVEGEVVRSNLLDGSWDGATGPYYWYFTDPETLV